MSDELQSKYGLPREVSFCQGCAMSNQRPISSVEFKQGMDRKLRTLHLDENGICDACNFMTQRECIDWDEREQELIQLLDQHRRNDGRFDCIVPGSGGKDSALAAHILKYKYDMHPLTVTWPPLIYTDIGWKNFQNWIDVGGFDNITYTVNGRVHQLLTKLAIENLFHPFQPFIMGQKQLAPKIALQLDVPLIFYGEHEAEYGNPVSDSIKDLQSRSYYGMDSVDEIYLGGLSISELREVHGLSLHDVMPYLPPTFEQLERSNIDVRFLGYYMKWTPQEAYYYAVEYTGFEANPVRSEGTYSKYNSLDDRIDGFHFYTTFIKFGIGRATYDASQEIRNKHLTRDEGVALIRRFDGEFPEKYFQEVMDYIGMNPERFLELCDEYRSPHLWKQETGNWLLRHKVT